MNNDIIKKFLNFTAEEEMLIDSYGINDRSILIASLYGYCEKNKVNPEHTGQEGLEIYRIHEELIKKLVNLNDEEYTSLFCNRKEGITFE